MCIFGGKSKEEKQQDQATLQQTSMYNTMFQGVSKVPDPPPAPQQAAKTFMSLRSSKWW